MLPGFLLVQWANIYLSVNKHNTWLLYKTSSHNSMIYLYLLTTFLLLRSLFLTTIKYSTHPNLTTTTFLPFLKHYLLNTTNLSSTLALRPVKNYIFLPNYSDVPLLVGSYFCIIKHCCKNSQSLCSDQPYFRTHVKRFLSGCIYLCSEVLYFILSDDDFEIKSKIYSFNLRLVLKHILHAFSR